MPSKCTSLMLQGSRMQRKCQSQDFLSSCLWSLTFSAISSSSKRNSHKGNVFFKPEPESSGQGMRQDRPRRVSLEQ